LANTYFQFKQFTVEQQNCAMKVCTDACLFGAIIADKIYREHKVSKLLDIGAGTGLLSLQVAQKNSISIDAVEIDQHSFEQAQQNFSNSPWSEKLRIYNTDILDFVADKKYDCIISNPPFYEGDLKSDNSKKNAAKHDSTLNLEQLLQVIEKHLSPTGYFAVLLPYQRVDYFIELAAEFNYKVQEQWMIRPTDAHPFFRGILFFSLAPTEFVTKQISIKDSTGNYTTEFVDLLKDYYLHL
jgi:tRNA1Val (adenine37-N6)-methyltransferase